MNKSVVDANLLFKFDFHKDFQEDFFLQLNRAPDSGGNGVVCFLTGETPQTMTSESYPSEESQVSSSHHRCSNAHHASLAPHVFNPASSVGRQRAAYPCADAILFHSKT